MRMAKTWKEIIRSHLVTSLDPKFAKYVDVADGERFVEFGDETVKIGGKCYGAAVLNFRGMLKYRTTRVWKQLDDGWCA